MTARAVGQGGVPPSTPAQWGRFAALSAGALAQRFGPRKLALVALLVLSIPLLMIGTIPVDGSHGSVAAARTTFVTSALIFYSVVFIASTEVNRVTAYYRWHLPIKRGSPLGCHLALGGGAWAVLVGGLCSLLPDEAIRIGIPCLLLGWVALPLSLSPSGNLLLDRGAIASIMVALGGLFLAGSTMVESPLITVPVLFASLAAGTVLSWTVAIAGGAVEERLPHGEAAAASETPWMAPAGGRPALVSLYRALYGPWWTWGLGLAALAAVVLFLQGKPSRGDRLVPLLLAYCTYSAGVFLVVRSTQGLALSLLVPVGRRRVFDFLYGPGCALFALLGAGVLVMAGRVDVSVKPCRELDGASQWVTRVEYRSSGLFSLWSDRHVVRAGNIDVAAADLSSAVNDNWGIRPDVGPIRERLARVWKGESPDATRPEELLHACSLVESDLREPVKSASRAMAFFAIVGFGLLGGLGVMVGRRPGRASGAVVLLLVAAWIGYMTILFLVYAPFRLDRIDPVRRAIVTVFSRGWWAILPAWLAGLGWIWFRSREYFARLDLEDVQRLQTSRFTPWSR